MVGKVMPPDKRSGKRQCVDSRHGVRHAGGYGDAHASCPAADAAGEMAVQPGVLWFAVVDEHGVIITHSNSAMVGKSLYSPDVLQQLHPAEQERWRKIEIPMGRETTPALEIYRQFQPMYGPGRHGMARCASNDGQLITPTQTIFIAFDASDPPRLRPESGEIR